MFTSWLTPSYWLLLPSGLLVVAGLVLLKQAGKQAAPLMASGMLMLYLLLTAFFAVAHRLTGSGIDSSVVYHLQTGLDGSGWQEFLPLIGMAGAGLLVSLWLCHGLFRSLSRARLAGKQARQDSTGPAVRWHGAVAGLMLAGAWALHPGSLDLARLGLSLWNGSSDFWDEHFEQVDPQEITPSQTPRDLVWIYLESLERTYLDEQRFPGLTPHLQSLEQQALHFTNLQETEGAGWTIAGLVASQCGTPLLTLLHGNALTGADRFMSNATCLGDVLARFGYKLNYLGGASLQFAGKGAFYRTHGFEAAGLEELVPNVPSGTPQSNWGLYDDTLYDRAWQTLMSQAQQASPLGMVMLTMDTHHPHGHVTPSCRQVRYGDGQNPMLNAVHCADRLVGDFVQRLRQHPRLKNALIVISSDHLSMPNAASDLLARGTRRNLLMMLHPQLSPRPVDRAGTTLDTAPTVLSQLGIELTELGYGRSLMHDQPTLLELMGPGVNPYLLGKQRFLTRLWRHPDLREGVVAAEQHIEIDKRQLRMPVLLEMDGQQRVTRVAYPAEARLPSLILDMPKDQSILWADRCNLIMPLNGQKPEGEVRQCMAIGHAGDVWHVTPLHPGQTISASQIREQLESRAASPEDPAQLFRTRKNWLDWGTLNAEVSPPLNGLLAQGVIRSSGRLSRPSEVKGHPDIGFVRGLTLLRVTHDGQVRKLAHLDTCASSPNQRALDLVPRLRPLAQIKPPPEGALDVLVAHDSAVCGHSPLPALMRGTAFEKAASLQLRQPYVGIWTHDGQVHEYTAPAEQTLTVVLQPQTHP